MGNITLTTEQAQHIEEALDVAQALLEKSYHHKTILGSYETIRAARAQEQAEQEPVNNVCVRCGDNCPRFICDTYKDWADKEPVSREYLASPLTEPVKQEPVTNTEIKTAYVNLFGDDAKWFKSEGSYFIEGFKAGKNAASMRTKDLTPDEIAEVFRVNRTAGRLSPVEIARDVIAADREKNRA